MSPIGDGDTADAFVPALITRLNSGFGPVLNTGRDRAAHDNDALAWKERDLGAALRALDRAQSGGTDTHQALDELHRCWTEHPHTVRAFLHQPAEFLHRLPALLRLGLEDPRPETTTGDANDTRKPPEPAAPALDDTHQWRLFAACADTLRDYLHGERAGAHQDLAPLAERTRFLALSHPFRHPRHTAWEGEQRRSGDLGQVFGHHSRPRLVRRACQARREWRLRLNAHQSLPLLDHAPSLAVEEELRALAFTQGFCGDPLVLADPRSEPTAQHSQNTTPRAGTDDTTGQDAAPLLPPGAVPPADKAIVEETVEHHLLPRFALGKVWATALGLSRTRPPWAQCIAYALVLLTATSALVATAWALRPDNAHFVPALFLAGCAYALVGAGTLLFGRLWAMPLMLRLPAAAAVGLIVLVALHPDWWTNIRPGNGLTGLLVVLGGASLGYLLIEARNHNSGQPAGTHGERFGVLARIFGRALAVTVTGAVHAFLVALLGMVVIAPVFSEEGERLTAVWTQPTARTGEAATGTNTQPTCEEPSCAAGEARTEPVPPPAEPWAILAAATAWCLAAGVFSQILWDDQPITAPLAHRRWRNER